MAFLKMGNIFPRWREHFPKMAGTLSQDVGNTFPKAWEYAYLKCRAAQTLPSAGLGLHKREEPGCFECKQEDFLIIFSGLSPKKGCMPHRFLMGTYATSSNTFL